MKNGIELIKDERKRQIEKEGWTPEHDAQHCNSELAEAAACYCIKGDTVVSWFTSKVQAHAKITLERSLIWPWDRKWWKPTPDDRVRELVKAGALIAAEIDRLQRI